MSSEFGTRSRGKSEATPSLAQRLPLLRPMEIGELLDEAFDLYKRNFRLFFSITVLLNVPVSLLTLAFPAGSVGSAVVRIVGFFVNLVTVSALTCAALDRLLGQETTIVAAYRLALRRLFRVFTATIIYVLAAAGGLILFVIPGLIVMLWSLLLVPVVVVENRGWIGALQRSRQLAAGNLWRLFFVALGLAFIGLTIGGVLGALVLLIAAMTGIDPSKPPELSNQTAVLIQAGYLLVGALVEAAWTPVFATTQLLAYLDLRIRREAYDLELLTSAVEARVAAARGGSPAGSPLPGQVGR